jgi:hypothetical protein
MSIAIQRPADGGATPVPKLFYLFGLALLGSIGFFGYRGQATVMGTAGGLLVVGMIFTRLDMFKNFKGFGVQAELREELARVEKVSSEAYATAEHVRALAKALSANALASIAGAGLWGGQQATLGQRITLANEILDAIRALGIGESEIAALSIPVQHLVRHRLAQAIKRAAEIAAGTDSVALRLKLDEEFKSLADYANQFVAPPSQFRRVLSSLEISGAAVEEAIVDYEYFETSGKLRKGEESDVWE